MTLAGPLSGLALSTSRLADGDVVADLVLEAQGDTVTVSGTVAGDWTGECRRCLEPTGDRVVVEVSEVFEPDAVEGETYPLGTDTIDLEPALREALALALPVAPLCDEACAGPDPAAHPVTTAADDEVDDSNGGESNGDGLPARDPRWGALDALRFDT